MATKEKETIYDCQVKKLFLRNGEKRKEWVNSNVTDAIRDEVTEFRCKECFGAVKLLKSRAVDGPAPHLEHKLRDDSEHCPVGVYFQLNPGREPRRSNAPVA